MCCKSQRLPASDCQVTNQKVMRASGFSGSGRETGKREEGRKSGGK